MSPEKDGIIIKTERHIASCNKRPESCNKRIYDHRLTPEDVEIVVPKGELNIVGKCSEISGEECYICFYQILGIEVKQKEESTNPKPQPSA